MFIVRIITIACIQFIDRQRYITDRNTICIIIHLLIIQDIIILYLILVDISISVARVTTAIGWTGVIGSMPNQPPRG